MLHCSSLIVKVSLQFRAPNFCTLYISLFFLICFVVVFQTRQSMLKLYDQVVELNGSVKKHQASSRCCSGKSADS